MPGVNEPVGHEAIRSMLGGLARERGRDDSRALHHAWLFAGPAGVGKFQTARWWASLLKCPENGSCSPACESCRLVAGAVHPDVFETGPAPKDKNAHQVAGEDIERKKSVGIAESRALIQRLSLKPVRPGPRIAIVREAATMTPEAQNSLLKLLEEPPGSAVVVLVTDNIGAMLTTVRSRCRHLAFGSLSDAEVSDALARLGVRQADAAAACGRGSVARALAFDADGLADREALLLAWERLGRDAAGAEDFADELISRKDDGYALTDILEWQIAKIEACLGRGKGDPSPPLAALLAVSDARDLRSLVATASRIEATIEALRRNANAKLVIRDLLMNVRA